MQKAYFLPVFAAAMLSLAGCAGSNIKETTLSSSERITPLRTEVPVSAAPSATAISESTTGENAVQSQMIYVLDTPMYSTGRTALVTYGTADGTIESIVSSDVRPAENGQANFDCQGSSYISLADGAAAVLIDGTYLLFLADDVVEYEGIYKKKSDVSEDTLKWLDFYYSLAATDRNALSMVPSEFAGEMASVALETESAEFSYLDALTDDELRQTEALAQHYFTETSPIFEGVDQIYPVDSDADLYHNAGLEGEYTPGNIIIYKVLTVKDRRDGNPFRFISVARNSKSDDWKIINSGY